MNDSKSWRPSAAMGVLRHRAHLLQRVRQYFIDQQVLEVETPILSAYATVDPAIESFRLDDGFASPRFLHTSPEFAMKRLLCAGFGDCYQVAKVFRKEELGRFHSGEFTLLEWYRIGQDHRELMIGVDRFVRDAISPVRSLKATLNFSYIEALKEFADIDLIGVEVSALEACLIHHKVAVPDVMGEEVTPWLDLIMGAVVSSRLPKDRPVFIYDYPVEQAALARIREGDLPVAERFELFIDGLELANGFHELADSEGQRLRFIKEQEKRSDQGLYHYPYDESLIQALDSGLPDCAGVALGIDRLLMVMLKAEHINEVLSFDQGRA